MPQLLIDLGAERNKLTLKKMKSGLKPSEKKRVESLNKFFNWLKPKCDSPQLRKAVHTSEELEEFLRRKKRHYK